MSDPYYSQRGPYARRAPYDDEPTEDLGYPLAPDDYRGDDYREEQPEPSRKHPVRTWLIIGLVVVVMAAAGLVLYKVFSKNGASTAEPGDCIKVNSVTDKSASIDKIDCADKVAVFKVAKKLPSDKDQCPAEVYPKYMQNGRGGTFALCLMLNAKEGDCFANPNEPAKVAKVDCVGAALKVVKVVTGKADETACDAKSNAVVYPEPPATFCITQP
jgi:hypothetical protein